MSTGGAPSDNGLHAQGRLGTLGPDILPGKRLRQSRRSISLPKLHVATIDLLASWKSIIVA